MKLLDELERKQVILIMSPYKNRDSLQLLFLKEELRDQNAVYVSLTETYDSLRKKFKEKKLDEHKFFIMDCVSSTLGLANNQYRDCSYFALPNTLPNLLEEIGKTSKASSSSYVLFDSLSNLTLIRSVLKGKVSDFLTKATKLPDLKFLFLCNQKDEKTFKHIFDEKKIKLGLVRLEK